MLELHGKQATLFVMTVVFLIISVVVVSLRCIARWKIRAFGWDDYFMFAGTATFLATCVTMLVGSIAGLGLKDAELTPIDIMNASHAFTVFEPFYILTLIFVKLSISFTLLRIAEQTIIRWIMYFVMALSTLSGFATFVAVLSLCHPISAAWTGEGHCADGDIVVKLAYFISATAIITDFTCAIVPSFILYKLHMNPRLKWTVAFILSLGFFASSATIVRLRYINDYVNPVNHSYGIADICIWTILECGLGIFAGSAPSLKPLVKSVAGSLFSTRTGTARRYTTGYGEDITGKDKNGRRSSRLGLKELSPTAYGQQLQSTITSHLERDIDADSQKSSSPFGIMVNNEVDIESVYRPTSYSYPRKEVDIHVEEA